MVSVPSRFCLCLQSAQVPSGCHRGEGVVCRCRGTHCAAYFCLSLAAMRPDSCMVPALGRAGSYSMKQNRKKRDCQNPIPLPAWRKKLWPPLTTFSFQPVGTARRHPDKNPSVHQRAPSTRTARSTDDPLTMWIRPSARLPGPEAKKKWALSRVVRCDDATMRLRKAKTSARNAERMPQCRLAAPSNWRRCGFPSGGCRRRRVGRATRASTPLLPRPSTSARIGQVW